MTWVGIIIGILLGAVFESFNAAVVLGLLGGFIGYQIAARIKRKRQAAPDDLPHQLQSLQEQMRQMTQRMTALEQRLPQEPAAAAKAAAAPIMPAPVSADDADDELTRQALAAATPPETARVAAPAAARINPADSATRTQPIVQPQTAAIATPAPRPDTAAQAPAAASAAQPAKATRTPPPPAEPSRLSRFVQRWVIGGNPLVKIGVLILFLGLAFLLRYVAENTVVPIELRYAGVAATAIGLLLVGWRWRKRADHFGLILQGAGIGVMYLTTLAAMRLHPLIPLEFGFAVLIAVAVFAALLAILQDALALAIVGTVFGFAAPVLASSGSANHVAFFTYLTLINLGIVAIAWFKAWRVLNLIGFGSSIFLGSAWGAKYYRPELFASSEPFLLLLFVLYVAIAFLFARRTLGQAPVHNGTDFEQHVRHSAPHVSYVDGTLVFGVPFACFGLQTLLVKHIEYGAAFSALGFGLTYIVLALMLFRKTGMRYALLNETMIALAVIFGSLALPLGLEQKWTAAAWAVEAAGVYWVGVRQQRVYARLFALLLLFGAAVYFALGLARGSADAVLDGSLLGSVMLALSTWWTYRLLRGAPAAHLHRFEPAMRPWLIAFGAFFIALMPFLLWPMSWASTALAILGALAIFASQRLGERALMIWGWLYQAAAGALFMTTLRSTAGGSVLAHGWTGLLAASLIGASMLAGVWALVRAAGSTSDAAGKPAAAVSGFASAGLLAGLVFINLAPLFVLPWRFAAMVWPVTGIATLWWAARARHAGAIGFALALQLVAGLAHVGSRLFWFGGTTELVDTKPFLHSGFWGPVLIACAAFACARLLQRRQAQAAENTLGWIALFWGGAWWTLAWIDELSRVVASSAAIASLTCLAVATTWLASVLARRLQWQQIGQATLAYLPALILLAAADSLALADHPLAAWGALTWPLALAMHLLLLHRQQAWLPAPLANLTHTVGAWLFVVLAAIELRWQFAHWASADSAWPLLGWMVAPVLYLGCLTSHRLRARWPLRMHQDAYLVVSAVPMVLYLLGWVWIANIASNGAANPLPYVPLLNPLEIAQAAVLIGCVLWWWSLREHPQFKRRQPLLVGTIGATALAVITGSVARTCHHWGGVAWRADALLGSTLVQTSLSIVWSMLAIGLMLSGNRSRQRWVWIAGAALIAVVVAKLFMVELAAKGSLARIVSFIVVGLLLLLVGYFAPLPPKRAAVAEPAEEIPA